MAEQVGLLLITTTPTPELAQKLAQGLVEQHLAACVNIIGPISSIYFWDNQIVNDNEYKLLIKSSQNRKEQAVDFIKKNHTYQVPEISTLPITYDNPDYADWLFQYVAKHPEK